MKRCISSCLLLLSLSPACEQQETLEDAIRLEQQVFQLPALIGQGLSAAVYTQTTDVEIEVNGLLTYDRELKFDVERTRAEVAPAGPD